MTTPSTSDDCECNDYDPNCEEETPSEPTDLELISSSFPPTKDFDKDRIDAADEILEKGDVVVCKPTRAGFTTSAILAANKRGLKILVVVPTRKIMADIAKQLVGNIDGTICIIPANRDCLHYKEILGEDRFLEELPIPLEKCEECEDYDYCPVTGVFQLRDFSVGFVTYSKLQTMALSDTMANKYHNLLGRVDLVIFDEAHVISYPSLPQVEMDRMLVLPRGKEFGILHKVYRKFRNLADDEVRERMSSIETYIEEHPTLFPGFKTGILPFDNIPFAWKKLFDIAKERNKHWEPKVAEDEVIALKNIIGIMSGKAAYFSSLKEGETRKRVVTGDTGLIQIAIRQFLEKVVSSRTNVCFVSGTLIERRPGFFSEVSGRRLTHCIFPDLKETNSKMHIHPSRWKFSDRKGGEGIERAIREINEICRKVRYRPIYLVAMNTKYAEELRAALKDSPNIKFDYYRSDLSMGIERNERICIAVGLAHRPVHSCDALAEGSNDRELRWDSKQLRLNEVHAATWQSWSRVKDPNGEVDSHVYCVGIRADEASDVVTWGTNRMITSLESKDKGIQHVVVDEELPRPKVYAEDRTSTWRDRHNIFEYIDRVQRDSSLIEYRRSSEDFAQSFAWDDEDIGKLIRVIPYKRSISDSEEMDRMAFRLSMLFTGRVDYHARKSKNTGDDGEFKFRKTETTTDIPTLIKMHLDGSETIGFYPFDDQDICYYCAVVLDDKDGDTPQRENAEKLSKFLLDNNLPVRVEKLTSSDSYHFWIPIIPTKTHTVYKFVRQLVHDADIKDAEVYPRQKSISSCHGSCGDFLVLPLGRDREGQPISKFVSPYTFAEADLEIFQKVIRLREMEESDTAEGTAIEEG